MAKPYIINITDGEGSSSILNGSYSVISSIPGYDNTSIDPSSLTVVEGTNEYSFKVAATGTLTLHVSEDGTLSGESVVGAEFYRCDKNGTTYGNAVVSDSNGNAVFYNVPFASDGAPLIYFKQTASDGDHEFVDTLQNTSMTSETLTLEIANAPAVLRTIRAVDTNYNNLPLDGMITLS